MFELAWAWVPVLFKQRGRAGVRGFSFEKRKRGLDWRLSRTVAWEEFGRC